VKRLEQIEPTSPPSFLLSTDFFPSPKKSFELPVYELMDVEACESDRSTSQSMIASSSTTDSEDGST
jgi:hypothetical protein